MRKWKALGVVVVIAGAFGLYWFQPWKLFTSKTVNDAAPVVVATAQPTAQPTAQASGQATASAAPAGPVLVASGGLISHEHTTSGTAQLVRLPAGGHQLVLRDLSTSDGPDLRVWLTDQPVVDGRAGWHLFDDGKHLELGPLKGTHGTLVYDVPADARIADYSSVTIWCRRFAVSFGAAELKQP
jgi:hypothetical protein